MCLCLIFEFFNNTWYPFWTPLWFYHDVIKYTQKWTEKTSNSNAYCQEISETNFLTFPVFQRFFWYDLSLHDAARHMTKRLAQPAFHLETVCLLGMEWHVPLFSTVWKWCWKASNMDSPEVLVPGGKKGPRQDAFVHPAVPTRSVPKRFSIVCSVLIESVEGSPL